MVRVCTAPAGCETDAGLAGRCIAVCGTTGIALCSGVAPCSAQWVEGAGGALPLAGWLRGFALLSRLLDRA